MLANSKIKQLAKQALAQNWNWAAKLTLVSLMLIILLSSVTLGFGSILSGLIEISLSLALLKLIGNKKEDNIFTASFSAFTNGRLVPMLITWLLETVFLFFWSLLFIIPGLIKSYSYAMAFYINEDLIALGRNVTPTEAITKSRQLMDGHKFNLFLLDVSFLGWYILSILTFGIGLIWLIPYHYAARAAYYRQLSDVNRNIIEA